MSATTSWLRYRSAEPSYWVEWSEPNLRLRCRLFYSYRAALGFARRRGRVAVNDVPQIHRVTDSRLSRQNSVDGPRAPVP